MSNMQDCKNCENTKWKNHYMVAQQRFDKVVTILSAGTVIAWAITVLCLIATICALIKLQNFIDSFEYVEETTFSIEQDEGINTAIIGGENNEVNNYGTDNN